MLNCMQLCINNWSDVGVMGHIDVTGSIVLRNISLIDGKSADIRIEGPKIAAVHAPGKAHIGEGDREINCHGGLAVRPFSEPHIHIDKAGTALLSDRVPRTITEAIEAMAAVKREAARDPTAISNRMRTMLEHLHRCGTRHVRALVDIDLSWELVAFDALKQVRDELRDKIDIRIEVFPQEGLTPAVADLMWQAAETGADAIGAHTDLDEDYSAALEVAAKIAREKHLPLQVHVDEAATPDSFRMPKVLEMTADLDRVAFAHCLSLATLDEQDQLNWSGRIADAGVRAVVAPSVLSFGLPLAPVKTLMDSGVELLFGSDNLQDVFVPIGSGRLLEGIRTVALVQRLIDIDAHRVLLGGITNAAYGFVTGEQSDLELDSPASLIVFSGGDARAVLLGDDAVRLEVVNGEIQGGGHS